MNYLRDKRFLGVLSTIIISVFSFFLVTLLLEKEFSLIVVSVIVSIRVIASFLLFDDYKLSWSKASTKTGLMKILLALASFIVYMPILYYVFGIHFNLIFIDLIFYTFMLIILFLFISIYILWEIKVKKKN